jgi:hypothetical protein
MAKGALIRFKTSTGLYLSDDRVVVTVVGATPTGVKQLSQEVRPLDEGGLTTCLAALQEERALSGQIVCGVASRRFFLITRAAPPVDEEGELTDALAGGLRRIEGGLVSGVTPVRLPGGPMLTLFAASRRLALDALEGLRGIKEKRLQLTGSPLALYQQAREKPKPSRKDPEEVRIFLGDGDGMAVLAQHGVPVALHMFDCPADRLQASVEMASMMMAARARDSLGMGQVDIAYLHVGEEHAEFAAACEAGAGLPMKAAPLIRFDALASSHALAMMGMKKQPRWFANLFERVFEPAGFVKNFPLVAVICLSGMLGTLSIFMNSAVDTLRVEADGLRARAKANYQSVGVTKEQLKGKHEAAKEEFRLASYFIADRAYWSDILYELPALIPETMTVEDFDAKDTVRFPRKKAVDASVVGKLRQMSVAASAPVEHGANSPPELKVLTRNIQECEAIQSLLPRIINSNVRLMPGVTQPMARVLITSAP